MKVVSRVPWKSAAFEPVVTETCQNNIMSNADLHLLAENLEGAVDHSNLN